jgi:hypothetical protein
MPLSPLNREQSWLLHPFLMNFVPDNHADRLVAEFVDALDRSSWSDMGIALGGVLYGHRPAISVQP